MKTLWPLAALLILAGCGEKAADKSPQDRQVTETVMDNVDDLQGTISDDMISIDDIRTEGAKVEDGLSLPPGDAAAPEETSADGSAPADSGGDPETAAE